MEGGTGTAGKGNPRGGLHRGCLVTKAWSEDLMQLWVGRGCRQAGDGPQATGAESRAAAALQLEVYRCGGGCTVS